MKNIILIGGGGHCISVADVIERSKKFKIIGFVDKINTNLYLKSKYKYLGDDNNLKKLIKKYKYSFICVGQIRSSDLRIKIFNSLIKLKSKIPSIVSPLSYISKNSSMGMGTILMHGAIVNANVSIGQNCIINSKSLIEHDVSIGNHNHISTGAILNGGVELGDKIFIGSGAIIKQGVKIGSNNFISAGSIVTKDIPIIKSK
tara:strand:+ start:63 stop:668 length:606 start_codon:yes stop_codon:yes gene_type:complete